MNKFVKMIGILLVTTCLVGCGKISSKEPMTPGQFKRNMEERGLTVVDQTDSAGDSTYQEIYVAIDDEKYSFEYYFMTSDNAAEVVYQYIVSKLNSVYKREETASIKEEDWPSVKKFTLNTSDYYCEVLKKENAVLYVTAYQEYKSEAKKIISELGY